MCSGLSDGRGEEWGAGNLPTSVFFFVFFGVCPKERDGGGRESSPAS